MRVLFITQYGPLAASSRTRVFQYLPFLERAGIDTRVRVVIPDRMSAGIGRRGAARRLLYYVASFLRTIWVGVGCVLTGWRYDRILIQKVLFPAPIATLLRRWRSRILFDFDDAVFTSEDTKGFVRGLIADRRRKSLPRMLWASAIAIVENEYTRSFANDWCDRVEIITGPIDTDRYTTREREASSGVVLGWIGSSTTTVYLDLISVVLAEVAATRPDVSLKLIGALPFEAGGMRIEQHDWSIETEVDLLNSFDIGLMPLPDDEWTRGKGGYKLLQYGAVGLPVVSSPVGVNAEIVDHGKTGFLANSDAEWIEGLTKLIDDADLRTRMGQAGRERMLERYGLSRSSERLVDILRSC